MARAKVWSRELTFRSDGGDHRMRSWAYHVTAFNGIVLADNGFADMQTALAKADKLARAVTEVESHGHRLRSWRDLVEEAGRRL